VEDGCGRAFHLGEERGLVVVTKSLEEGMKKEEKTKANYQDVEFKLSSFRGTGTN
jgi:hypothetical protein